MKKLILAASFLAASIGASSAADLAARPYTKAPVAIASPVYDWSGFYVGANGGYGTSRKCWDVLPGGVSVQAQVVFLSGPEGCHNATGGLAGGQVGYRWQSSSWVFGLEAQGDWAGLSGSRLGQTFGVPAFGGLVDRSRVDGIGLFTAQAGYAWNSMLIYVKGGAAIARDRYDLATTIPNPLTFIGSNSETRWGGAIGVGGEYGFAPNWSVGLEYDHLFMGRNTLTTNIFSQGGFFQAGTFLGTQPISVGQGVDLFTARVNYRFGGPVVAKY